MRLSAGNYLASPSSKRTVPGLTLTTLDYPPHQKQPWHTHENASIFILIHGEHQDHWPDRSVLHPSFGSLYRPANAVHASEVGDQPVRGLAVEFSPEWLERWEIDPADDQACRLLASTTARFFAIKLVGDYFTGQLGEPLNEVCFWLHPSTASKGIHQRSGWLKDAEGFIRENYRSPIGLSRVAEAAAISPTQLARTFRAKHHCTVGDYIHRLRLVRAAEMYLQGCTLAETAAENGFCDQSYLWRCFARDLGWKPSILAQCRPDLFSKMVRMSKA